MAACTPFSTACPLACSLPCDVCCALCAVRSPRGQMYAQLLPEILSSRMPKTADGKQYPVAGGAPHAACGTRKHWLAACSAISQLSLTLSSIPCLLLALLPAVWTSTLQRTIITASGLPYPKVQWKALDEIQVGERCELCERCER